MRFALSSLLSDSSTTACIVAACGSRSLRRRRPRAPAVRAPAPAPRAQASSTMAEQRRTSTSSGAPRRRRRRRQRRAQHELPRAPPGAPAGRLPGRPRAHRRRSSSPSSSPTTTRPTRPASPTFVNKVGATTYWSTATSEYGVGAATATAPVVLTETAPALLDDSTIQTWLHGQAQRQRPGLATARRRTPSTSSTTPRDGRHPPVRDGPGAAAASASAATTAAPRSTRCTAARTCPTPPSRAVRTSARSRAWTR